MCRTILLECGVEQTNQDKDMGLIRDREIGHTGLLSGP
jgi:hypothetical protein